MRFYRTVQDLHKQTPKVDKSYEDFNPKQFVEYMGDQFPCHFGQKKLFYVLFDFLTLCSEKFALKDSLLVYAGAAPGNNIKLVSQYFPDLAMDLYDPARFSIKPTQRINIFSNRAGFVKDSTCRYIKSRQHTLKKKHLLFVSDIRRTVDESEVLADMISQQRWGHLLSADAICFKFRSPYESKMFNYIKGDLYFQIRAPPRSAELRLIAFKTGSRGYDQQKYDCVTIDNLINYHNMDVRTRPWKSVAASAVKKLDIGLEADYEGVAEYNMAARYLTATGIQHDVLDILRLVKKINADLLKESKVDTREQCKERTKKKYLAKHAKDIM